MAKVSQLEKHKKPAKHPVQAYHRCELCGNPRGYMGKFKICRKCFRELAHKGFLPGVRKASW